MIYIGTLIKVIDNSGVRWVQCLKILGKSFKSRAKVGDILVVSSKKVLPGKSLKKGEIFKAVVVRTKFKIYRYGGIFLSFDSSAVVLLNNRSLLLGTRILGPVCLELRQKNFLKILSLAPIVF